MRNRLTKPLPDSAAIRARFKRRQDLAPESPYYLARLAPRDILFKTYIVAREIADELGPAGCRDTGFYDILRSVTPKLFECIPNPRTRRRVRKEAGDFIGGGLKKVLPSVAADIQELVRVIQKRERNDAADWEELKEGLRAAEEWYRQQGVKVPVPHGLHSNIGATEDQLPEGTTGAS
jgi:hypothetical protein